MTNREINLRLREIGIPPKRYGPRARFGLRNGAVLVTRRFPALQGTPWNGPIWEQHDPGVKLYVALERLHIDCETELRTFGLRNWRVD